MPLAFIGTATADKNQLFIKFIDNKQYVSLYELIVFLNLESNFDFFLQRGKIYNKNHQAAYAVGLHYMIIDGKLFKSTYPVDRFKGEIMIPLKFIEPLIDSMFPGKGVVYFNDRISLDHDSGDKEKIGKKESTIDRKLLTETSDRISFIIIDPGHGGKDPGAMGRGGIKEKSITLKIARYVENYLSTNLKGIKIRLSRDKDIFIELFQRTEFANRFLKDKTNGLFVSIHVNAALSPKISGFETYFLSQNPTNEEARNTAALENDVVIFEEKKGKTFRDVDYIEAMMITTQIQKESSMLADQIQAGISGTISKNKSRGVKKADFFVLRGSLMPAALVEVGYITNRNEAALLLTSDYQKKIARGVADGVIRFIKKYNSSSGK